MSLKHAGQFGEALFDLDGVGARKAGILPGLNVCYTIAGG